MIFFRKPLSQKHLTIILKKLRIENYIINNIIVILYI